MTEVQWQACENAEEMLVFLRGKSSDQKLWSFACLCYRQIWSLLDPESPIRSWVQIAEHFLNGSMTEREVWVAQEATWPEHTRPLDRDDAAWGTAFKATNDATSGPAGWAQWDEEGDVIYHAEQRRLAGWVRDIFGPLPFRPIALPSYVVTETIFKLGQTIYDERAWDRLPILADALEEAGCTDAEILNHCRQPGEHWRGCWVVDLVLGKS